MENPLGIGGEQLHEWALGLAAWRKPHGLEGGEVHARRRGDHCEPRRVRHGSEHVRPRPGGGPPPPASSPWGDEPWTGWWGDDPPFHVPAFVLTDHAREPLALNGGTTFTFVTHGSEAALDLAKAAAAGRDVVLGGGARVARQYLAAKLLDEFTVSVVPVLLGSGERLLDDLGDLRLEQVRAIEAPGVTHLSYRVVK